MNSRMMWSYLANLLVLLIFAFSTRVSAQSCEGVFGPTRKTALETLAPDVAPRFQKAARALFDLGLPEMNNWNLAAVEALRATGLPKDQLNRMIEERVKNFIAYYPALPSKLADLGGAPERAVGFDRFLSQLQIPANQNFAAKYRLEDFRAFNKKQTLVNDEDLVPFAGGLSLEIAFELAMKIDRKDFAETMVVRATLLRAYDSAIKMAETLKSDDLLVQISRVALADYFFNSFRPQLAAVAISGLQRVEGRRRDEAGRMLADLASELMVPAHVHRVEVELRQSAQAIEEQHVDLALRALRSIGRFDQRLAVDSVHTTILKIVEHRSVRESIQALLHLFPDSREAPYAKYSIGALAALPDSGFQTLPSEAKNLIWFLENEKLLSSDLDHAFKRSPTERQMRREQAEQAFRMKRYSSAFDGFLAAADRDGLLKVGDALFDRGAYLDVFRPYLAASILQSR